MDSKDPGKEVFSEKAKVEERKSSSESARIGRGIRGQEKKQRTSKIDSENKNSSFKTQTKEEKTKNEHLRSKKKLPMRFLKKGKRKTGREKEGKEL